MLIVVSVFIHALVALIVVKRFAPSRFILLALFLVGAFLSPVALTYLVFPGVLASSLVIGQVFFALVASTLGFIAALVAVHVLSSASHTIEGTARTMPSFTEDRTSPSWPFVLALLIVSLAALAASIYIHVLITGAAPWQRTAYEQNLAFAQFDASVGLLGRVARLGMPIGLFAFIKGVRVTDGSKRYLLIIIVAICLLSLLSVRRAPFMHLIAFLAAALMIGAATRQQARAATAALAIILTIGLSYFGFIQVETHKGFGGTVLGSAITDGAMYIAGNIAYVECMRDREDAFGRGFAFPLLGYAVSAIAGTPRPDLSKPFCGIGSVITEHAHQRVTFNTSPLFFDIAVDLGYPAMLSVYFAIGATLATLASVKGPSLGLLAMVTVAAVLTFRENLFGQLDFATALLVYVALLFVERGRRTRVLIAQRYPTRGPGS